jgi:single-strand DNA-binding protein
MNKVFLIGNLGKDPEMRHLEGGAKVCRFTLATNESYINRSGERVNNTEWHDIEVWDRQAEIAEKYLRKGRKVMIEGKIRSEQWKDKEGIDRQRKTIRCLTFEILDREHTDNHQGGTSNSQQEQQQAEHQSTTTSNNDTDHDLPF